MAKRNRKNVKTTESINELGNEAATVLGDSYGPRPEVTAAPEQAPESTEEPVTDPIEAESAAETPQDAPEQVEEPTTDGGTEEHVQEPEVAPEDVEESGLNEQVEEESQTSEEAPTEEAKTEEPAPVVGRKSKLSDDAMVKVLFTENPQRKGTYSHAYNEKLMSNEDLTVKKAMDLGVPRHHLLYLSKEGKIEVVNG